MTVLGGRVPDQTLICLIGFLTGEIQESGQVCFREAGPHSFTPSGKDQCIQANRRYTQVSQEIQRTG